MSSCNDSSCQLKLIGYLKAMPNDSDNKFILLERLTIQQTSKQKISSKESELYCIHIGEHDFFRINQFGYMGMLVSVFGDLHESDQTIKIIAKKIEFLHVPASGKFDDVFCLNDNVLFDGSHVQKLKTSTAYESHLYYHALRTIH